MTLFPHIYIEYTLFFIFTGKPLPINVANTPPLVPVTMGVILLTTKLIGILVIAVVSAYPT